LLDAITADIARSCGLSTEAPEMTMVAARRQPREARTPRACGSHERAMWLATST